MGKITTREKEILDMISKGLSTIEIAAALFISNNTVKTHRKNMMLKLDANNSAVMVRKGFEYGLIQIVPKQINRYGMLSIAS